VTTLERQTCISADKFQKADWQIPQQIINTKSQTKEIRNHKQKINIPHEAGAAKAQTKRNHPA